ncbi:tetratricopeptide repeat protein [Nonomuraea purpurea]|uniref:Tetratricopeptide repeat protein n=1 Tax=Nonomuraea purpurea TaxID=1849276 RepID=A0ABV8GPY9_9ACTN
MTPPADNASDRQSHVCLDATASGQGQVYQAGGHQTINHNYPPQPEPGQIVEGDIPQRPPGFQERPHLMERLAELLGEPGTSGPDAGIGAAVICAVGGTPGVGKTLMAASYAWACQAARWPVVAWIPAETTEQIHTGLAALAQRLDQRQADDDAATAATRVKAWLAATERPTLLVFDNATDVATVRRWCPATGATRVVITTRNRAFLRLFEPVEVEVFTSAQAQAFLYRRTGQDDPAGATGLADDLGHLPLALDQAATVIARLRLSYAAYRALLRDFPVAEYLPARPGDPYPVGAAEAILLSITQAESTVPDAAALLSVLSVLSSAGIPLAVLHALTASTGLETVRVRQLLADLADTSLITYSEDGTSVLIHRLVQRVLRERAAHQGTLDTVLSQAVDLLHTFNAALPDGPAMWAARAVVEMLVEQTDTVYRWTLMGNGLSADLLSLRQWCGRHLYDLADFTRAIPLLKTTLADLERVLGADHPDTLNSRNNLAYAYQTAGDLSRAILLHEATLADSERVLGTHHPDTLNSRNNLAYAYQTAGDLSRAILLHEATLADRDRLLGPDHPDTLTSRNNLALAYQMAGDLGRAIPLMKATLANCERVLGTDHPDTLTSRNNLATAHREAGDLGRAIPLHEATLADRDRLLGTDHPDTLTSRHNLASAYREAGDLGRAIPLHEATLAGFEQLLGADHPHTLTSRNNLAGVYEMAGDLGRAILLHEATLADRERVLGADHPDTLQSRNNLAAAYQMVADLGRAIPLYEQTLADYERVLGGDHPDTLISRNNLAAAYQMAGDLSRAIPLLKAALVDCERVLGADHSRTRVVRKNLEKAVRRMQPERKHDS